MNSKTIIQQLKELGFTDSKSLWDDSQLVYDCIYFGRKLHNIRFFKIANSTYTYRFVFINSSRVFEYWDDSKNYWCNTDITDIPTLLVLYK